jgi:hypothetical protein
MPRGEDKGKGRRDDADDIDEGGGRTRAEKREEEGDDDHSDDKRSSSSYPMPHPAPRPSDDQAELDCGIPLSCDFFQAKDCTAAVEDGFFILKDDQVW